MPYGLAGLGFALIFRTAKELNFAFGATIAIGGYVTYSAAGAGAPVPLAMVLSLLVCALIGFLLRWGIFSRLRDHFAVLLFSFALSVIIENALQVFYGVHDVVADTPAMRESITLIPGTNLMATVVQIFGLVLLLVIWAAVWWAQARSKTGLGMTAVIRDAEIAELVGVRSEKMKLIAYAVGSALAGVAGSLTVMDTGVRPTLGFSILLYGFIATLLAGNRFVHTAIWGLAFAVVLNLSAVWLESQYRTLVAFAILVVYLIVRMLRLPRIAL
ncbi:branched-chain amino acid ABC transporter permease [Agrococcus baldri]|uniref:Branched-chain amino acid ABC transporter permease n=1 Tax=Agrococcus baldri TaxID=153730 RepID=A0AA87URN1_9MICO|nr:branched-chain amino acid ABC transporter permease [Agrococcus baldri]